MASSKTEPQPVKKVNPVRQMEQELSTLHTRINTERDLIQARQNELATLLALRAGAAKFREPLAQGAHAAQRLAEEARDAVTRHLGKETESVYVEKLYEADQAARAAVIALADFDKQYEAKERTAELRTSLQQSEDELKQLEQRRLTLTAELDQAIAHATTQALLRVLSTYNDLYDILSTDGPTIAKMRLTDPILYRRLMVDLTIEQDILFRLVQSDWTDDGQDHRPILLDRQQAIREMLMKLKKGI